MESRLGGKNLGNYQIKAPSNRCIHTMMCRYNKILPAGLREFENSIGINVEFLFFLIYRWVCAKRRTNSKIIRITKKCGKVWTTVLRNHLQDLLRDRRRCLEKLLHWLNQRFAQFIIKLSTSLELKNGWSQNVACSEFKLLVLNQLLRYHTPAPQLLF